jgi:hypothetical protein
MAEMTDVNEDEIDDVRSHARGKYAVKKIMSSFQDMISDLENEDVDGVPLAELIQDMDNDEDAKEAVSDFIDHHTIFNYVAGIMRSYRVGQGLAGAKGAAKRVILAALRGDRGAALMDAIKYNARDANYGDDALGRDKVGGPETDYDSTDSSIRRKGRRELRQGGEDHMVEKFLTMFAADQGVTVDEIRDDPEIKDSVAELLDQLRDKLDVGGSQRPVDEEECACESGGADEDPTPFGSSGNGMPRKKEK